MDLCYGKKRVYGEEMAKTVKIEKELFEAILSKMVNAKPPPLAKIAKFKKNLSKIPEKAAQRTKPTYTYSSLRSTMSARF